MVLASIGNECAGADANQVNGIIGNKCEAQVGMVQVLSRVNVTRHCHHNATAKLGSSMHKNYTQSVSRVGPAGWE